LWSWQAIARRSARSYTAKRVGREVGVLEQRRVDEVGLAVVAHDGFQYMCGYVVGRGDEASGVEVGVGEQPGDGVRW
jgi:hypothetical protein